MSLSLALRRKWEGSVSWLSSHADYGNNLTCKYNGPTLLHLRLHLQPGTVGNIVKMLVFSVNTNKQKYNVQSIRICTIVGEFLQESLCIWP